MKLNNKGISLLEMLVSIALISIILIFLSNLFLKVRADYNSGKTDSEYELLKSNILNAVYKDINNYGVKEVTKIDNYKYQIKYNQFRDTYLNEYVTKYLYFDNSKKYMRYGYVSCTKEITDNCSENLTVEERMNSLSRKIPNNAIIDSFIYKKGTYNEIKIPIQNGKGLKYDINIYFKEVS